VTTRRERFRNGWIRDGGGPPWRARVPALVVWLCFILAPIVNALGNPGQGFDHWLAVAGATAFSVIYIGLVFIWLDDERRTIARSLAVVQLVLAVALTVLDRPSWAFVFSYCAACAALVAPSPWGFPAVLAETAICVAACLLGGSSGGTAFGFGASAIGVGLLLTLMRDLRMRNEELSEARAELARTAVAAERERFARDLHDLLGHSLSVITIKTELAGRLLPSRPDQAATEIRDVEQVARQALREVREAVSGYHKPTLAGEMEGARVALSAAGIDAAFESAPVTLDPEVEAVLAWTVREGATNVIRHSGARRCQVKVVAGLADAAVEVVDDGSGCAPAADGNGSGPGGHGLAGLTERAQGMRGRIEAGSLPDGGFRLAVSVPTAGRAG
jgi:two-component system sensor histidine kinase DesK